MTEQKAKEKLWMMKCSRLAVVLFRFWLVTRKLKQYIILVFYPMSLFLHPEIMMDNPLVSFGHTMVSRLQAMGQCWNYGFSPNKQHKLLPPVLQRASTPFWFVSFTSSYLISSHPPVSLLAQQGSELTQRFAMGLFDSLIVWSHAAMTWTFFIFLHGRDEFWQLDWFWWSMVIFARASPVKFTRTSPVART